MRTFLFVQLGKRSRPTCLAHTANVWSSATWEISRQYHMRRCPKARWWIVMAMDAAAGRDVIGGVLTECRSCDGCGWHEGGKALQTTCGVCSGRGGFLPGLIHARGGRQ